MFAFADSTIPSAISPMNFTHVAGYVNGKYQWPEQSLARFERHFLIGVYPNLPQQAHYARCLDMERYDASARDFPAFVRERHDTGHDDALGYTSILGNAPDEGLGAVVAAMKGSTLPWQLWVAWWWGRPFPPTKTEVLAEIKALTKITLDPGRLAACQWQNGAHFDMSVWYGRDTFTTPAS